MANEILQLPEKNLGKYPGLNQVFGLDALASMQSYSSSSAQTLSVVFFTQGIIKKLGRELNGFLERMYIL